MQKKILYFYFIIILFFLGCSSESSLKQTIKDNNISLLGEPYFNQQWYIDKNDLFYTQHNINNDANIHPGDILQTYSGKGITIAVIDEELDIFHEDLQNTIINTYNILTNSNDTSLLNTTAYHGTAVTGIIAARINSKGIAGIANQSNIIFLQYANEMTDSQTIELFDKAVELGADIINCSWGTYDVSLAVKDKIIDIATNSKNGRGIPIIFACGNDDISMQNDESSISEVISVGSSNKYNLRAWYSNYGSNLDLLAPGGYDLGIATLDPTGKNGISYIDDNYLLYDDSNKFIGTSASAPIVTSIIALMLEKDPSLTRIEIESILKNTADKIGNIDYINNKNDYYGYGKINLEKIMESIK